MRPARTHNRTNKNQLCLLAGLVHGTEVRGRDGLNVALFAPPPLDRTPARALARRAIALPARSLQNLKFFEH